MNTVYNTLPRLNLLLSYILLVSGDRTLQLHVVLHVLCVYVTQDHVIFLGIALNSSNISIIIPNQYSAKLMYLGFVSTNY